MMHPNSNPITQSFAKSSTLLSMARYGAVILGASLFIALCAQISIPFYPVPMTMQPFAVLWVAMMLPRNLALSAVFLYLLEAFMGLPFLTGGFSGPLPFVGPTSGYLLGYLIMTAFISSFYWKASTLWAKIGIIFLGYLALLASGVLVLSGFIGLKQALITGLLPFILKEIVQGALALTLTSCCKKYMNKFLRLS